MAYRTKYHNIIWNNYLNKVFDFIGLTFDSSSGCSRVKWVGCNFTKNNKPVPAYFLTMKYDSENKIDLAKINVVIKSQDEFLNYKANKENYEYFNPIIKYKQMLKLLLMMTPIIYERYCITESNSDIDDLVDMIVSDERTFTQEEILEHINIKEYPSVPGLDGEMIYGFGMEITRDNGETCFFKSESKNKSVAILLLMLQVIELIDGSGDMNSAYFNDELRVMVEDCFEEYAKERERNYKDLKKVVIEKDVTEFASDTDQPVEDDLSFVNDTDDLITPNVSSEEKIIEDNTDSNGVVDISKAFQKFVPIEPKESDDDPMMNFTFI